MVISVLPRKDEAFIKELIKDVYRVALGKCSPNITRPLF